MRSKISIFIPLVIGGFSALFTSQAMKMFETMNQPPLSPPAILFPIVWTILYLVMGIGAYLIGISDAPEEEIQKAERVYKAQLAVNFLWPTFFFHFQWYLFSFVWLLLLWVLALNMIIRFWNISKTAAKMNFPYLIWLTFAAYLNFGIYLLN